VSPAVKLSEIAARLGRTMVGARDVELTGVAPIESAGPHQLSFVRSLRWARHIEETRAGALIVPEGVDCGGRPAIPSPDPGLDFVRAVALLVPQPKPAPGIHPAASMDPSAQVHPEASVGAGAVVGARCRVGARSILHPRVVLYDDAVVGEGCELHSGCVLREGTRLGDRVIHQPGVVLGGDGFGYALAEGGVWRKFPQVGRVVVEDDVEIGANTTVDRAALGDTWIRRGAKIDNLVQIAHGCEIGEDAVVVAQSALGGSTIVERGAILMGRAASTGHLRVGERAFVGAHASLHKDVAPGGRVWGTPQMEERLFHRVSAALLRLPDLLKRVRAIEKKLGLRGSAEKS
jgi:UDP-3-O-[3-hydroxymyristoyl] glucosamine N-acyltransferase